MVFNKWKWSVLINDAAVYTISLCEIFTELHFCYSTKAWVQVESVDKWCSSPHNYTIVRNQNFSEIIQLEIELHWANFLLLGFQDWIQVAFIDKWYRDSQKNLSESVQWETEFLFCYSSAIHSTITKCISV